MPITIEMPKLSDTMTEGTLVKWLKNVGDTVESGDVIAEVETDKATMEMQAFDDGTIHKIYVEEGGKAEVGGRLAILLEEGEEPPSGDEEAAPAAKAAEAPKPDTGEKAAPAAAEAPAPTPAGGEGGRVKASPLAKKVAAEKGVDLSSVSGSGPGGRIVGKDVQAAAETGGAKAPAPEKPAAAPAAAPPAPAAGATELIPLSGMRRVIAERLVESKTTIPHFYLNIEVDAAPMMQLRAEVNAANEAAGQPKLTVNDFVLKAAVAALRENPMMNASFTPEGIVKYASVNLAVAVAVDEGLVTPVVRDAQNKSIREIGAAVKDMATRARNKKLTPNEFQGGTITVSSLGAFGVETFDAIVNPPQAAILSIGAIVKKPVVGPNDEIVAGQRMGVGMSIDHRVVDGVVGAKYLAELKRLLENPTLMLL
jgi:pyruvate dehydrogenase E2 component (dihydrolipoamide acetyltransferase)